MTITITKNYDANVSLTTNEVYEIFSHETVYDHFITALVKLRKCLNDLATIEAIKGMVNNNE